MERIQAFAEYAKILDESEDWLANGYRRSHPAIEVIPPRLSRREPTAPTDSDQSIRANQRPSNHLTANINAESDVHTDEQADSSPEPERSAQLNEIAAEVAVCRSCDLYLTRKNTVSGVGTAPIVLMVVTPPPVDNAGENDSPLAPSEHEYLGRWLKALNLDPENDVFITPAVKCRTPGGRPPRSAETTSCQHYLRRQYKALRPKAVLALGSAACAALTGSPGDFRSLVGEDWTWGSVPALVLWTPAEVLANPGRLRSPVWEALKSLKAAWDNVPRDSV